MPSQPVKKHNQQPFAVRGRPGLQYGGREGAAIISINCALQVGVHGKTVLSLPFWWGGVGTPYGTSSEKTGNPLSCPCPAEVHRMQLEVSKS